MKNQPTSIYFLAQFVRPVTYREIKFKMFQKLSKNISFIFREENIAFPKCKISGIKHFSLL